MNLPVSFSTASVSWFLGWFLIHVIWQVACAWVIFKIVLLLTRESHCRTRYLCGYALLLAALIAPFVTTLTTLPDPPAPSSLAMVADEPATSESANRQSAVLENDSKSMPLSNHWEMPATIERQDQSGIKELSIPPSTTASADSVDKSPVDASASNQDAFLLFATWAPRLVTLWLIGILLFSLRPFMGLMHVHRLRGNHYESVNSKVAERFKELTRRAGIQRVIGILESSLVQVPTLIGIVRPIVLLPLSTLSSLSARELDAILLHELAHVRRMDILFNFVQSLIETVLFFHPLVWLISNRIRNEREKCCDDFAVRIQADPKSLATALFRLEQSRQRNGSIQVASANAAGGNLKSRIQRLVAEPETGLGRGPGMLAGSLAALVLLLSFAFTSFTVPAIAGDREMEDPWQAIEATIEYRGDIFQWKKLETKRPSTAQKVADLFPQSDQGKTGKTPAGWKSDTTFRIVKQNRRTGEKRTVEIRASFYAGLWTEGNGDWDFGPTWELRYLISQLVRENKISIGEIPKAYAFSSLDELKKSPKNVRHLQFRSKQDNDFKDEWLEWICNQRPEVEILDLNRVRSLTDAGTTHLLKLKALHALRLGFAEKLRTETAKTLAKIPTLEVLDVSYAKGLSSPESVELISQLPNLRYFVAVRHSGGGMTRQSLDLLTQHGTLKTVALTRQHPVSKVADMSPLLVLVDDRPGSNWFSPYLKANHQDRKKKERQQLRDLQQSINFREYTRNRQALKSVKEGKWVVIGDGKLTTAFDSFEDAHAFANKRYGDARHRYIFRPGIDDVSAEPFYLSPWNSGSPNWNQLGRRFRFEQKISTSASIWLRGKKQISTPGGKALVQFMSADGKQFVQRPCVASGMFPEYATITESDAAKLDLFQSSVPSDVTYGKDAACRRVFCRVEIPGLDVRTNVLVYVIPDSVVKVDPPRIQSSNEKGLAQVVGSPVTIQRHQIETGKSKVIRFSGSLLLFVDESDGALKIKPISADQAKVEATKAGKFSFTATLASGILVRCQIDVVDEIPKQQTDRGQQDHDQAAKQSFQQFFANDHKNEKPIFVFEDAFYVYGTLKDEKGNPVSNAKIEAKRFIHQPHNTATTTSDQNGRYILKFGPGFRTFIPNDFTTASIPLQAMHIVVSKDGYFESQFCRAGDIFVAGDKPKDNGAWVKGQFEQIKNRTMLRKIPRRIDFTMKKTVPFSGTITDENGKRLTHQEWTLIESDPPEKRFDDQTIYSATITTDSLGRFDLPAVPANVNLKLIWKKDGIKTVKSESFKLTYEDQRPVHFTVTRSASDQAAIEISSRAKVEIKHSPLDQYRVRGTLPPKNDKRKLDFGKETNGLAAALMIPIKKNYELPYFKNGDQIQFRIVVRNQSKETIRFKSSSWRQEDQLIIKDKKGGVNDSISRTWYSGWPLMIEYELRPGEECELTSGNIGVTVGKTPVTFSHPVVYQPQFEPGIQHLQLQLNLPDIEMPKNAKGAHWSGQLISGRCRIEIAK